MEPLNFIPTISSHFIRDGKIGRGQKILNENIIKLLSSSTRVNNFISLLGEDDEIFFYVFLFAEVVDI